MLSFLIRLIFQIIWVEATLKKQNIAACLQKSMLLSN